MTVTNLGLFFPPGTRVLALPNWHHPRLYLPAQRFSQRWHESAFYPASRLGARLHRLLLRIRAVAVMAEVRTVTSSAWPLGEFTENLLPQLDSAAILVGASSASQKVTVQLRDERGVVLGYLKHAGQGVARTRLRHEHYVLSGLSKGMGPKALKYGTFGNGEALLMTPISGRQLPTTLPPANGVVDVLLSFASSPSIDLEGHPWVLRTLERGSDIAALEACLEALVGKRWPIAVQHGDFAPWNLLRKPGGEVGTFDWEYGRLEGFPYLDLAYYILQTAALIYRWAPAKAARYAVRYLTSEPRLALSTAEAQALTRLAAYDAYYTFLQYGRVEGTNLQVWRRAIWKGAACDD
jgi:hypothetical protein